MVLGTRKSNFESANYDTALQNETDIISKCDCHVTTKYGKTLLQNAPGIIWKNATVVTNCDGFITKCNIYYNIWHLLQNASVQCMYCESIKAWE